MPSITDHDELDLTGMEIGAVDWTGDRLKADYGGGYGDFAVVGPAHGLWGWEILSDGLTDDDSYQDLIEGVPSYEYYVDFIRDHITGAQDVFVIDFRGLKFHASFEENSFSGEMLTYDLFSMAGVRIKMRRVRGFIYRSDGAIFDPTLIESQMWARYKDAQDFPELVFVPGPADAWANSLNDTAPEQRALLVTGDVVSAPNVLGTHDAVRFNNTTNDGYLRSAIGSPITLYEAIFVIQVRSATFATFQGILTAPTTTAAMVGNNGDTKLVNLLFGPTYSYSKNAVELTEANQLMPMNTFGVVHARWSAGITLDEVQVGWDRDLAARFGEIDIIDLTLCDQALDNKDAEAYDRWLIAEYGVTV